MKSTAYPATTGLHALMDRYLDGDEQAFVALHAALTPRLRAFVTRLVRDTATADDVVQATWLKAHLARERFEAQGPRCDGAVQAWYFTIARNLAFDHLRGKDRERRLICDGDPNPCDELPTAEEMHVGREEALALTARVQAALARLPEGQREIVELHKLHGMTMAEIATRLQIREGTARVRAHRAYQALARSLGPVLRSVALIAGSLAGGAVR